VRLAIDRLGSALEGDFWCTDSIDGRHYACLGRADQPASFDAVLAASATRTLLRDGLTQGTAVPELLSRTAAVLPIHCCVLLEWSDVDARIAVHRLRGGCITHEWVQPVSPRTIALTTLAEPFDRQAATYADAYAFDTPGRCVDELRRFFGGGTPGGVLVLQVTSR
jgi:hypothetical protein